LPNEYLYPSLTF